MTTWWEKTFVLSFSPGYVEGWYVGDVCSLQAQLGHLKSAELENIKKIIQNVALQNSARWSMFFFGSKYAEWNISIRNTNKTDLWRFFTQLQKDISNLEKFFYSWDQIRWIKCFQLLAVNSISTWFGTNIRLSSWRLMWETLRRGHLNLFCIFCSLIKISCTWNFEYNILQILFLRSSTGQTWQWPSRPGQVEPPWCGR